MAVTSAEIPEEGCDKPPAPTTYAIVQGALRPWQRRRRVIEALEEPEITVADDERGW